MVKLLFIVGPPGVGHQMFYALMPKIIDEKKVRSAQILLTPGASFGDARNPELHKVLSGMWREQQTTGKKNPNYRNRIRQLVVDLENIGCTHFVETTTFPYGHPYTSTRRPDLIELFDFIGDVCDIKMIVLYRNPVAVAYSGVRRGFTKNLSQQAAIIENNWKYIVDQLKSCPKDSYKILRYENFFKDFDSHIKLISAFWDLKKEDFINALRKPATTPEKEKKFFKKHFTEECVNQWKFITENIIE